MGNCYFPSVSLFITDKRRGRWVDTNIRGRVALIQLIEVDAGVPLVMIRIWQENEVGDPCDIVFETEIPFNFHLEIISIQFTAITCLKNDEYFGFYFNKGASDCSEFNKLLTDLHGRL